ncbi:MAG: peptide/nickel transport system permease protein [Chloroflexota bacterium]|jgi:ABC-type dipeptide/oligopeptide/nickel transport system permease subunit|nr:peptide/nickel transport system permease protein [Chloroflexota bacterium]
MAASAVASPEQYLGEVLAREQTSLWADAWRRLKRNRLALVGAVYLTLLVLVALLAIVWTPYPVDHQGVVPSYAAPSLAGTPFPHLLGGDASARDILSRLMVGAQISLIVGVGTQIAVLAVGIPLGLVAGFYRGPIDAILTFIINVFYGIPDLLVALILVFVLSGGTGKPRLEYIIIAIAGTRWMDMARLVRGQTLSLREREFVEAAKASGARPIKTIFGHILPNSLGPIIVQATLGIPQAILFEAFLSFLGLGVPPPTPSWGAMASDGIQSMRIAVHIVLAPSIALSVTLMAFNFLGDGLRDALDPRQKR